MAAELSRLQLAFSTAGCSLTVLKGVAAALQGLVVLDGYRHLGPSQRPTACGRD